MERYTIEHRVLFMRTYYKHNNNFKATVRKLLGQREAATVTIVTRLVKKLEDHQNQVRALKILGAIDLKDQMKTSLL